MNDALWLIELLILFDCGIYYYLSKKYFNYSEYNDYSNIILVIVFLSLIAYFIFEFMWWRLG